MTDDRPAPPPAVTWIVDLDIEADVTLPGGAVVDRDTFLGWLWEIADADEVLGIAAGSVAVDEAAAAGLVATPLVLDAAAAPADRDWVGRMPVARVTCGFTTEAARRGVVERLAAVGGCRLVAERAETPAGADDWRAAFGPVAVPGFGRVLPAWDPGEPAAAGDGATIFIEPGIGFGTGLHDTTQLCLAALADWRRGGGRLDRVLDFGSGSGILGIAAAVLGAGRVDAVEIDGGCHAAIRGNAARNGVVDRLFVTADLPAAWAGYDVVIANIVAAVLLEHAAVLCKAVRRAAAGVPVGTLVLCGLRAAEVAPVAGRYGPLLGGAPAVTTRGDWHCLRFG